MPVADKDAIIQAIGKLRQLIEQILSTMREARLDAENARRAEEAVSEEKDPRLRTVTARDWDQRRSLSNENARLEVLTSSLAECESAQRVLEETHAKKLAEVAVESRQNLAQAHARSTELQTALTECHNRASKLSDDLLGEKSLFAVEKSKTSDLTDQLTAKSAELAATKNELEELGGARISAAQLVPPQRVWEYLDTLDAEGTMDVDQQSRMLTFLVSYLGKFLGQLPEATKTLYATHLRDAIDGGTSQLQSFAVDVKRELTKPKEIGKPTKLTKTIGVAWVLCIHAFVVILLAPGSLIHAQPRDGPIFPLSESAAHLNHSLVAHLGEAFPWPGDGQSGVAAHLNHSLAISFPYLPSPGAAQNGRQGMSVAKMWQTYHDFVTTSLYGKLPYRGPIWKTQIPLQMLPSSLPLTGLQESTGRGTGGGTGDTALTLTGNGTWRPQQMVSSNRTPLRETGNVASGSNASIHADTRASRAGGASRPLDWTNAPGAGIALSSGPQSLLANGTNAPQQTGISVPELAMSPNRTIAPIEFNPNNVVVWPQGPPNPQQRYMQLGQILDNFQKMDDFRKNPVVKDEYQRIATELEISPSYGRLSVDDARQIMTNRPLPPSLWVERSDVSLPILSYVLNMPPENWDFVRGVYPPPNVDENTMARINTWYAQIVKRINNDQTIEQIAQEFAASRSEFHTTHTFKGSGVWATALNLQLDKWLENASREDLISRYEKLVGQDRVAGHTSKKTLVDNIKRLM